MSEHTIERADDIGATTTGLSETTPENPVDASGRRLMLRRLALGGAGAVGGVALLSQEASAGDSEGTPTGGTALELGSTAVNTTGTATTVTFTGTDPLDTTSALSVGVEGPNETDGNDILPAALGGYGKGAIVNGVHGSTVELSGAGVVAAHLAPPQPADAVTDAPAVTAGAGLVVASAGGPQIRFAALPGAVAGPTTGLHAPGELYVDADGTLWFTVPASAPDTDVPDPDTSGDEATDKEGPESPGVRFIKLAATPTAGQLHTLPFPTRVFDSRSGDAPVKPAPDSATEVDLTTKLDAAPSGLAAGATAALLNITIADSDDKGFFSVAATGVETPGAEVFSNGNWTQAGTNLGTSVTTAISPSGAVTVTLGPEGGTHLIIDVVGYYA